MTPALIDRRPVMSLPDRRTALLLAALSISLAACGRAETPPEASTPPASPVATAAPAAAAAEETAAPPSEQDLPAVAPVEAPAVVPAAPPAAVSRPPAPVAPPPVVASMPPPAFAGCAGCHSVEQGAAHKMGPNLFGVVGSRAGSQAGYAYSPAMSGSDLVWTETSIDAFLAAPREVVPGTRMAAPPVRDAGTRRAIVEYLASLK